MVNGNFVHQEVHFIGCVCAGDPRLGEDPLLADRLVIEQYLENPHQRRTELCLGTEHVSVDAQEPRAAE